VWEKRCFACGIKNNNGVGIKNQRHPPKEKCWKRISRLPGKVACEEKGDGQFLKKRQLGAQHQEATIKKNKMFPPNEARPCQGREDIAKNFNWCKGEGNHTGECQKKQSEKKGWRAEAR